jgi:hypothetical protein
MPDNGPLVFISCGQYLESERELGRQLAALVTELLPGVTGYFAQNESSLQGLSQNVLSALDRCVGFVAVMHPRGMVSIPGTTAHLRGSVWIEQEIAIASFLTQIHGKKIPTAVYIHSDIKLEGLRQLLQLNQTFTEDAEVVTNFRALLASGSFLRLGEAPAEELSPRADPYAAERKSDGDYFSATYPLPDYTGRLRLRLGPRRYEANRITRESARNLITQMRAYYNGYSAPIRPDTPVSAFGGHDNVSGGVETDYQSDQNRARRDARRLHCSGLYSMITLLSEDFDEDGMLKNDGNRTLGFKHLVFQATLQAILARNVARSVLSSASEQLFVEIELAGARGRKLVDDTNLEVLSAPILLDEAARSCGEQRISRSYAGTLDSYEKELGEFALEFIMEVCELFNAVNISREDARQYQMLLVGRSEPTAFPFF